MHEAKLVSDIVREANKLAFENGYRDVRTVRVEIGALNHATPASLGDMLIDATVGTQLADASFQVSKSDDKTAPDALDVRLVSMTVGDD